jgi:NADPH:quinone reductase-like Zn-dependent oxidoreductase
MELVRSLGADQVIDYTKQDLASTEQTYDLIFAANGYNPVSAYKRALSPGGIYVMAGGTMPQMFEALLLGPWLSMFGNKKIVAVTAHPNQQDLTFMIDLIVAGKVRPVIDRRYPLREVPEALRYLYEGHARGKVVITISGNIL